MLRRIIQCRGGGTGSGSGGLRCMSRIGTSRGSSRQRRGWSGWCRSDGLMRGIDIGIRIVLLLLLLLLLHHGGTRRVGPFRIRRRWLRRWSSSSSSSSRRRSGIRMVGQIRSREPGNAPRRRWSRGWSRRIRRRRRCIRRSTGWIRWLRLRLLLRLWLHSIPGRSAHVTPSLRSTRPQRVYRIRVG